METVHTDSVALRPTWWRGSPSLPPPFEIPCARAITAFADCFFGKLGVCIQGSGVLGKGATEPFLPDLVALAALLHWPSSRVRYWAVYAWRFRAPLSLGQLISCVGYACRIACQRVLASCGVCGCCVKAIGTIFSWLCLQVSYVVHTLATFCNMRLGVHATQVLAFIATTVDPGRVCLLRGSWEFEAWLRVPL